MRIVPFLAAAAILVTALPAPTDARSLWFEFQLTGPVTVVADRIYNYDGQLSFRSGQTYAPVTLIGQDVRLMIDGVTAMHARTDAGGHFAAPIAFPRGVHRLTAASDLLGADSNALSVTSVAPPTMLTLTGVQSTRWNYSHLDWTVDDGGYPAYQFTIWRSVDGGALSVVGAVGGFARSFEEPVPAGAAVTYEVGATNFAGLGAPIAVWDTTPSAPVDSLAASLSTSFGCECSAGGGWYWGYPTSATIQSNHAFYGAPTVSGHVSSLGAPAAARKVTVSISSWLNDYCYAPNPCPTTHVYPQAESAIGTVAADGSFSVTLPTLSWTWGGGADATSKNVFQTLVTIDGESVTGTNSFDLATDMCAPPYGPCGGGF